jgi:hypothetical protein
LITTMKTRRRGSGARATARSGNCGSAAAGGEWLRARALLAQRSPVASQGKLAHPGPGGTGPGGPLARMGMALLVRGAKRGKRRPQSCASPVKQREDDGAQEGSGDQLWTHQLWGSMQGSILLKVFQSVPKLQTRNSKVWAWASCFLIPPGSRPAAFIFITSPPVGLYQLRLFHSRGYWIILPAKHRCYTGFGFGFGGPSVCFYRASAWPAPGPERRTTRIDSRRCASQNIFLAQFWSGYLTS